MSRGLCVIGRMLYVGVGSTREVYVIGYTLWTTSYGREHVIDYSSRVIVHGLWSRVIVHGLWSRVMVSGYGLGL